ncbi:MAG: hypothetical protein MRERC_2c097 [Mycoplasmataceae bacterium RC_NB112A]|nr:MAG: hypothetical protein MRERC_2c097 [Mycoplasmataceae bacterium RC_NB112A]
MNKPFTQAWWDKYDAEVKDKILEDTKSGSISFLEGQGNYASRKEIYHAHWEDYLSSSPYFKNWREKINSFKTEKEVNFYTVRLRAFIEFVEQYTCKDINNYCGTDFGDGLRQWDPEKTPQLIEQELKRLENISEEEFKKEDKWSGVEWKEMDVKEISDFLEWEDNERKKEKDTPKISNKSLVEDKNLQNSSGWKKGLAWGSISVLGLLGLVVGVMKWKK